jgi:diguanylate cyclase (GGDEF)-like protein
MLDVVLLLGFLNLFATLPLLMAASIHAQRVGARRAVRLVSELAERQQDQLEQLVAERTRQLDEANRQLEHASQTDALTGLRNRRYLARQLPLDLAFYRREAGESHSPPHALYFALVDIDHFKHINDTLGHRAGDDILQQFAAVLSGLVRSCDYAVRWGGEEFLLVLRPMPSEHVATIGERICRSVAQHRFDCGNGTPLELTCSVGFAEQALSDGDPAASWEALVELADAALYWVKQNGRDGWAVLRPTGDRDPAALASLSRHGAQHLIDAGLAVALTGRSDAAARADVQRAWMRTG